MNCDGTGYFQEGYDHELICFTFSVDGAEYTWHQPRNLINWEFQLTEPESKVIPMIEAKENLITESNMLGFMTVVRFALSGIEATNKSTIGVD